jgi:hypothetical protein
MASARPTNHLELRVIGLQRSGNHAIITWILNQHLGQARCFLNDVGHGNADPYTSHNGFLAANLGFRTPTYAEQEQIRLARKTLLVYSLEDDLAKMCEGHIFLNDEWFREGLRDHEGHVGRSEHRLDVLIIRDPFNFFASRLKALHSLTGCKDLPTIISSWTLAARRALAISSRQDPTRIVVSFNAWFASEAYRRTLSQCVLGSFDDDAMSKVTTFGGGSSFDGKRYDKLTGRALIRNWRKMITPAHWGQARRHFRRLLAPNARQMQVLERWRVMEDDPVFRAIFRDPEVLELSEALFGELPGTRRFVESVRHQTSRRDLDSAYRYRGANVATSTLIHH